MNLFPEERETICGVSATLRSGETTCVGILKSCMEKIEHWEPDVQAWAFLDLDQAMAQAKQRDQEIEAGRFRGPLHGIPVGIKDIIDVDGMPTGCGSRQWKNRLAPQDARVVGALREAGAIILGKTVTTAYAWVDPPITRNPWNLQRTPGGSSSGSVAAVATGMCLGAFGSQTGGSIIRPASFCGVAGLKPSYQFSCCEPGVLPFAPSLDHVGPIARSVADLTHLFVIMFASDAIVAPEMPKIGLLDQAFWKRAEPSMRRAFTLAIESLQVAGAEVIPIRENYDFDRVVRSHRTIMASEAAAYHRDRLSEYPDDYPPRIRSLLEEGLAMSAVEYLRAKRLQAESGMIDSGAETIPGPYVGLCEQFDKVDVLATPATLGPAPDPSTTGDPSFNSPWSFFGFPTLTFPIGLDSDGLPLGIQLIGSEGDDLDLLAAGAWCERVVQDASKQREAER